MTIDNTAAKEETVKYLRWLADQIDSGAFSLADCTSETRNMSWNIEHIQVNVEAYRSINHE